MVGGWVGRWVGGCYRALDGGWVGGWVGVRGLEGGVVRDCQRVGYQRVLVLTEGYY